MIDDDCQQRQRWLTMDAMTDDHHRPPSLTTVDEDHHSCPFQRCRMQRRPELMSATFGLPPVASPRPRGPVPWALLHRALRWRLSPSHLWARRMAPLARMGGCSGRGAGRALVHAHRGSASAFSTTPAQEGHDPWAAQVRTPVLTTLIVPLGLLGWR